MRRFILLGIAIAVNYMAYGQISHVREGIDKIIENKDLKLGFALYDFSNGDTLSINGSDRYPMQSVFKFPIALAVLNEVDGGKWELNQSVLIKKSDMIPDLWSPIREKYPQGDIQLSLSEIVRYTVAQSDNVGCDLLLKMLGGPSVVNKCTHNKGITDICIKNNEQEIQSNWNIQFENWTTPQAMIELLKKFNNKELLMPVTHSFLWNTMVGTSTGAFKNQLPKDAVVARKTGTSGYNKERVSAATNDVGVLVLPSGNRLAYVIFLTDSRESEEVSAGIIADIAKLLYYSENK